MLPAVDILNAERNPPDEINVVVEIPKGSSIKYVIDPKNGEIYIDRILFPSMHYPFNYGLQEKNVVMTVEQIRSMHSYLEIILYYPSQ
ncbi:MAG: inorganic diphosphatase [Candidatus Nitrosopolaris sp.]